MRFQETPDGSLAASVLGTSMVSEQGPPSRSSRMIRSARHAHAQGELGRAEALYTAALKRDPDNFDALHLLGMLNYQRGRLEAALALLRAALKIDSRRADALSDTGLVLHGMVRFEEALDERRCRPLRHRARTTRTRSMVAAWRLRLGRRGGVSELRAA
jgi:Tfp pilus assembly protein PilF